MGQVIPKSRQSFTNLINVSGVKNNCVIMKSAPASTFSLRCFKSSS